MLGYDAAMRFLVGLIAVTACAHHDPNTTIFDAIVVDPPQATLNVPLAGTAMQPYQVFGMKGGTQTDITADCMLSVDPNFGTATDAVVTVGPHGGKTSVVATCGSQAGMAQLIVQLTGTIVVGTNTPSNAPQLFGAATAGTDPSLAPTIQYPIDMAIAPLNIPPMEMQWSTATDDLFHVAITANFASIDAYTTDPQVTLSVDDWNAVVGTAAGDNIAITVEGMQQAAPQLKYASAATTITMSNDTIDKTALYYWASSQGNMMTQTFGTTTAPTIVRDDCTSCHSVVNAAPGTRIGYSRCVAGDCGQLYAGFMHFDPMSGTWLDTENANTETIHGSYTTFAPVGNPFPDDSQSVAIVSMVDGTLALYDPDLGTPVTSNIAVATDGPGMPRSALMADWSADGTKVVFASTPHPSQWIDLSDSSIATMSYAYTNGQHTFGEPQFLITQPITRTNGVFNSFFFPSYSPDGQFIVFDAARAAWRDSADAPAAGQRLMLSDPTGANIMDLTALNGGDIDADVTWPHWAPGQTTDYYWVVFSSERNYGHEVTPTNTNATCKQNGVHQCKQIWIGAISKAKLAATGVIDPSAAPVWLPGQDITSDNISPYWSVPSVLQ